MNPVSAFRATIDWLEEEHGLCVDDCADCPGREELEKKFRALLLDEGKACAYPKCVNYRVGETAYCTQGCVWDHIDYGMCLGSYGLQRANEAEMNRVLEEYVSCKSIGFPYAKDIILTFIGGSQLHGAKLKDTDDTDWYGLFIEPPAKALGTDSYEHFVHTTGGERGGNRPGDTDVTLYSLRKWAGLACKGNPSVLHFLFAKPETSSLAWDALAVHRKLFLAKSHVGAFLGYANAQLRRLLNQQGQKNCHRPFLEQEYGYDTKYAMHITRLLHECRELLEFGQITLPRPEKELLIDIRKGKFKLHELVQMNNELEVQALEAREKSPLPEKVDRAAISKLVAETYLDYWAEWVEPPPEETT